MLESITQAYRQQLKQLLKQSPWIKDYRLEPAPGHIDLIARFLVLCEEAMGNLLPEFDEFTIRHLNDEMEIIALPRACIEFDADALAGAISLTTSEAKTLCPECGSYSSNDPEANLWQAYRCCADDTSHLWETIPDIMIMLPMEREELFTELLLEELEPQSFSALMQSLKG